MKNLIQPIRDQNRALAFGLSWHTILGHKLDEVAVGLARRRRATHYTRGGSRSTVAGLLTLSRPDRKGYARVKLYSAAAAFARACPQGVVAIRWVVPNGVWIAAASDGEVLTGSDIIHESEADAQRHLQELRGRYPDLVVHGDAEDEKALPTQALLDQMDAAIELRPVTKAFARVPVPVWVVLAVIGGWVIAREAMDRYEQVQAQRHITINQHTTIDPVEAWRGVLQRWSETVSVHTTADLKAALKTVGEAPLKAGRWDLMEVSCDLLSLTCTAQYERTHLADNLSLLNALPAKWKVNFLNLNNATATWHVSGIRKHSLNLSNLTNQETLNTTWSSAFQRLAPAFSDISLSTAVQPGEIRAPFETRPDGISEAIPFPKDSSIFMPKVRELKVSGPLRSLHVLNLPPGVHLTQLQVRRAYTNQVDISKSALVGSLIGRIYVQ